MEKDDFFIQQPQFLNNYVFLIHFLLFICKVCLFSFESFLSSRFLSFILFENLFNF
ncbi:Hypothetical Protein SLY_1114 [Strawberry lethal yellows phytoplasma (CPA) str. NZSb11]|uniref:Uncharacterized protein n=1 Tax=Strawberry lethal yellows phytoplasma (CPA) str. NZSb11 TaxID=980422 RepID=R4RNR6_PHYAS|nr:Hypothetical Protein SLY_1114 [Strawberry lethal yellows phytoplasma (CPA) str. NZSb11]